MSNEHVLVKMVQTALWKHKLNSNEVGPKQTARKHCLHEKGAEAKTLYVVTNQNDELSDSVWEVSSFKPKTVEKSWDLVNDIKLLKLRK